MRMGAAMDGTKRHEEMIGEKQNVGAALAERRNREHQDIQPEIKILAEAAGLHGRGKIDVGDGDEARFNAQSFGAAESFERAFLQDAQEFTLRAGGEGGDFVKDDGAVASEFEAAKLAFNSPSKGAAFVAEEFALDEMRREAGTIDLQVGRIAAWAEFMYQPREVILAGTAFAGD